MIPANPAKLQRICNPLVNNYLRIANPQERRKIANSLERRKIPNPQERYRLRLYPRMQKGSRRVLNRKYGLDQLHPGTPDCIVPLP